MLALLLCGENVAPGEEQDDYIYVGMNMHWQKHTFELPRLPDGRRWHRFMDTSLAPPREIVAPGQEAPLRDQEQVVLGPRSVVILVGR